MVKGGLGILFILVMGWGRGPAFGATIHVDDDNCPGPGDGSVGDPFCSIQAGIDAAVSGADEVVVEPGTYSELIDFSGKAITVRSTDPSDAAVVAGTVIDASGVADPGTGKPVVRCDSGEGPGTVLAGFTITGGTGDISAFGPASPAGGGMFNHGSSPTVRDCRFVNNGSGSGGGMFNDNGNARVERCLFLGNTAERGGGMFNLLASPTVVNCRFLGNLANSGVGVRQGGGMFNQEGAPRVTGCVFSGNGSSESGGAMANATSGRPLMTHCTFTGNTATLFGGGLYQTTGSGGTARNCVFWANADAGGMDATGQIHIDGGTVVVTFSDVQGGWSGSGESNLAADPLLADADGPDDAAGTEDDDVRLSAGSPCIDAGLSLSGLSPDLDGNARPVDHPATADTGLGSPGADLGAYEFGSSPASGGGFVRADFDEDGDVDGVDFAKFASCFNKAGNPPRTSGCPE